MSEHESSTRPIDEPSIETSASETVLPANHTGAVEQFVPAPRAECQEMATEEAKAAGAGELSVSGQSHDWRKDSLNRPGKQGGQTIAAASFLSSRS
jgi:hypothetical protein